MKITKQLLENIIKEEIIKEMLLGKLKNLFAFKKREEIFPKPLLDKYEQAIKNGMPKDEAINNFLNPQIDLIAKEIKHSLQYNKSLAGQEAHATKKEVPAKIWEGE